MIWPFQRWPESGSTSTGRYPRHATRLKGSYADGVFGRHSRQGCAEYAYPSRRALTQLRRPGLGARARRVASWPAAERGAAIGEAPTFAYSHPRPDTGGCPGGERARSAREGRTPRRRIRSSARPGQTSRPAATGKQQARDDSARTGGTRGKGHRCMKRTKREGAGVPAPSRSPRHIWNERGSLRPGGAARARPVRRRTLQRSNLTDRVKRGQTGSKMSSVLIAIAAWSER